MKACLFIKWNRILVNPMWIICNIVSFISFTQVKDAITLKNRKSLDDEEVGIFSVKDFPFLFCAKLMIYWKMTMATILEIVFSWKTQKFYPNLRTLLIKFRFFIHILQNNKFAKTRQICSIVKIVLEIQI